MNNINNNNSDLTISYHAQYSYHETLALNQLNAVFLSVQSQLTISRERKLSGVRSICES